MKEKIPSICIFFVEQVREFIIVYTKTHLYQYNCGIGT